MLFDGWIAQVSGRWFDSRYKSAGTTSSALASAGIAMGVAALVVVLGVMNGFQTGYMDSILEVSSFHVRVVDSDPAAAGEDLSAMLRDLPGVRSVLRFSEGRVLVSTASGRVAPLKLMLLEPDFGRRDRGFAERLGLAASTRLGTDGLVLGSEAARQLGVAAGETVTLVLPVTSSAEGLGVRETLRRVAATFTSGYYQFDSGLGLVVGAADTPGTQGGASVIYGIKLHDLFADAAFVTKLRSLPEFSDKSRYRIESWREYNRAFFGALRTEKTMMLLLVGLIFLVVGVNIHHAMRRVVAMRSEDIAVLRSLGASSQSIRSIFAWNGVATGIRGAVFGLMIGLFIAVNINEILSFAATVSSQLAAVVSGIAPSSTPGFPGESLFYMQEVPVRVLCPETILVCAVAIGSAVLAAYSASSASSKSDPAEILRRE
jgi:lipoprotein-releasing system permease protein